MKLSSLSLAAGLSLAALAGTTAHADTIFDSGTPDGGFFGYTGYDIFTGQSVGVAFTPTYNATLDSVGAWIMSNDFDNPGRTYTLSLVPDASGSATPSVPNVSNVIESWNVATTAVGWTPVLDLQTSTTHPLLSAGVTYWLVADSTEEAPLDPVWVWGSSFDSIYSGQDEHNGGPWQATYTQGSAPGAVINATAVPEPTALALLALAGIGTLRRRRIAE